MADIPLIAWVALAGAGIPVMAAASANGARTLGSVPLSAAILFGVAAAGCAVLAIASTAEPVAGALRRAMLWLVPASVLIAFYLLTVSVNLPRLGVHRTILTVLVAQVAAASAIEHFGVFGAAARPLDAPRALGIALVLIGFAALNAPGGTSPPGPQ